MKIEPTMAFLRVAHMDSSIIFRHAIPHGSMKPLSERLNLFDSNRFLTQQPMQQRQRHGSKPWQKIVKQPLM